MTSKPSMRLPAHVTVGDVADAAREGLKAFLAASPDKRGLAEWLVGPYRDAIRFAPARVSGGAGREGSPPSDVGDLMAGAKRSILAAIAAAMSPGAEALVACLPAVVHVAPVMDVTGARGFLPFDALRAKLVDRVLSLLVSDYLTRPDDFLAVAPMFLHTPGGPRSGLAPRMSLPVGTLVEVPTVAFKTRP